MEKRQIVNIVNFIRAVEPRVQVDLMKPVTEQIRLMKEHHLQRTDAGLPRRGGTEGVREVK